MKKSQVLAALALAFALGLGVVAPVANTYAKILPSDVTADQKKAIEADVAAANKEIGYLEDYQNYKNLYVAFEGKTGLVAQLDKIADDQLKDFNTGLKNPEATNGYISEVTGIINNKHFPAATEEGASLKSIAQFTGNYTTLKQAYDAIQATVAAATDNVAVLTNNYDTTNDLVSDAIDLYNNILWDLQPTQNSDSLISFLEKALTTALPADVSTSDFVNTVKAISSDAYESIVKDPAYIASPTTAIQRATDFGLIIKAAQALPKYQLAGAVATAEANVAYVSDTNPTVISYDQAQAYVEALNTAIKNYEDGKAPVTPDTPVADTTISSVDGNITVTGKLPAGEVFVQVTDKSDEEVNAFKGKKYVMYDINLVDKNGDKVTFEGDVTVRIKVPENIDGTKARVYYVNGEGTAELVAANYNSYAEEMVFTVSHFSKYAIVEDNGVNVSDSGVLAAADGTASSTVAIVAGIATALTAAGAGVVAYRNARRAGKEA